MKLVKISGLDPKGIHYDAWIVPERVWAVVGVVGSPIGAKSAVKAIGVSEDILSPEFPDQIAKRLESA